MDPRLPARLARLVLPALAAAFLAACAQEAQITGEGPGDPAAFRRVAVLPFSDTQGHGREISAKLSRLIPRWGFDPVDAQQLDQVIRTLEVQPGEELSMATLNDIRQKTLADAVLMGSVDSKWSEADFVVAETQTGDVVYKARVKPLHGYFQGADELADRCSDALSRWSGRPPAAPPKDALPEPE